MKSRGQKSSILGLDMTRKYPLHRVKPTRTFPKIKKRIWWIRPSEALLFNIHLVNVTNSKSQ
jgi:hypothetical protein